MTQAHPTVTLGGSRPRANGMMMVVAGGRRAEQVGRGPRGQRCPQLIGSERKRWGRAPLEIAPERRARQHGEGDHLDEEMQAIRDIDVTLCNPGWDDAAEDETGRSSTNMIGWDCRVQQQLRRADDARECPA